MAGADRRRMSKKGKVKGKPSKDDDGDDKESMAFKVLTQEQTNELLPMNVNQIQDKLKEIFNLENNAIDITQASILDYYTSAVYWGIQQKFTAQQLSGFFTVMHTLLENIKEKHLSMTENSVEFSKMLAGIGVDEVKSGSLDFFSVKEAKVVSQYVYTTLFQHYRLFLFMFTHSQAEEIIGTDLEVEVAKAADVPFPPPLDEGVSADLFQDYIKTPPPTPSPEHKSRETKSALSRVATPKTPKSRGSTPRSRGTTPKSRGSASKSRGSSKGSASRKKIVPEEEKPDPNKELEDQVSQSDLFAELTPEDVREVVESVTKEMLGNLQSEIALKLQDKESQIIQRINKIHKVAE
ncbi:ciliary-associated calcium-binding coiled-coil protein 1-like isoform X2 [Ruditapes philippinarum]|uniref:ciliary-associated calcium-binding coiled-coil protein 1-like isoform X2 n=2 Tax=Ruditapes philippinarum TaxID=129788 RepID=UPI00295AE0EA|nr:ciliary-associated calcium-binding coiled-coil protein 1-like isoform X2 [Ruditapes philippinarum]